MSTIWAIGCVAFPICCISYICEHVLVNDRISRDDILIHFAESAGTRPRRVGFRGWSTVGSTILDNRGPGGREEHASPAQRSSLTPEERMKKDEVERFVRDHERGW